MSSAHDPMCGSRSDRCGFTFGNGCSEGETQTSLFGSEKKRTIPIKMET
jgi:nitrate reductase beta subunit